MTSIPPTFAVRLEDGSTIDLEVFVKSIAHEEAQAALASAGLLPSPNKGIVYDPLTKKLEIWLDVQNPDTIDIKVYPTDQIIEWSRLISTFQNIERHAGFIYDHLREQNAADESMRRMLADGAFERLTTNRKSAMRKAATMRDSARQLAMLLRGKNLNTDPDEEMTGGSRG